MSRSILTSILFSFLAMAVMAVPVYGQETSQAIANIEAAIGDMQTAKNRAVIAGDQAEVDRLNGIITRLRANLDQQKNQEAFDASKQNLRDQMVEKSGQGLTGEVNEIAKSIENVNNLERSANEHRTAAANADGRDARNTAGSSTGTNTNTNGNTNNQPANRNGTNNGVNNGNGIGAKVVEGLFGVGTALLQSWLQGGQSNEERAAMDRIFANNDAAAAGADPANPGTPIFGPNGEIIGYDRNGDDQPDSRDSDGDGQPDSFSGSTYDDDYTNYSDPSEFAYDDYTNQDETPAFTAPPAGNSSGGGASAGNSSGASLGADTAADDDAEDEDGEDEEGEDENKDGENEDEEDLADADDDETKSKRSSSNDDEGDAEVQEYVGRIFILPKDAITAAAEGGVGAVGNQAPGQGEGFADDGWNDSDNGDWADEEDDWGWEENEWGGDEKPADPTTPAAEPGVPAMGAPLSPEEELLKQEIIQVEAEIAKWNKAEREKKLQQEDPYAFETTRGLQGEAEDPFAAYRNEDGKLDLTKVNVWIVAEDSWKEQLESGEEAPAATTEFSPTRMRLIVPDELLDRFEPIQGGWVSLRGTPVEAEFNPAVFPGLQGSVQDLDLVQVLAVTKEEPANLDDTEYSDY